jgi:hypothetical protein
VEAVLQEGQVLPAAEAENKKRMCGFADVQMCGWGKLHATSYKL